jgi:hypothetical protein
MTLMELRKRRRGNWRWWGEDGRRMVVPHEIENRSTIKDQSIEIFVFWYS